MFEVAELGRKLRKKDYKKALEALRPRLIELGRRLRSSNKAVVVVVGGVEGAGKSEVVNRLAEWLDPRGYEIHSFWEATEEERERPENFRYWRRLPARGKVGIFFGSWYTQPIIDRATGVGTDAELAAALTRITRFETLLAEDDYVVCKLWFHIDKKTLHERLSDARKERKSREEEDESRHAKSVHARHRDAMRVSPLAHDFADHYDAFVSACETAIRWTDAGHARWHLVESVDIRYRDHRAAELLAETVEAALDAEDGARLAAAAARAQAAALADDVDDAKPDHAPDDAIRLPDQRTILDRVDLSARLSREAYEERLDAAQDRLYELGWRARELGVATVICFEGWDAAGKGGAIRRVIGGLDARLVRVVPVAAPTDEERAHPWLWRFWRNLPRDGRVVVFDRTWYGRVLVERVEGFAKPAEWMRAYNEINHFEEELRRHGVVLCKFWLHISPEEQLARFRERQEIAWKQHKITPEDWRNRGRWADYALAVDDMVARTSTSDAPWTLVAGDDKKSARVQVVETVLGALERGVHEAQRRKR